MPKAKANPRTPIDRHAPWILAAILFIAAIVRLANLGEKSLWADEWLTVSIASEKLSRIPHAVRQAEQTPPLTHFITYFWIRAAGISESAVRLPAALFGIASVWAIYLLAAALADRRAALFAAALLALAGYQIGYSQEARGYTMLVFTSLISTYFLTCCITAGGWKYKIAYILTAALLPWIHLHGVFVIAAQQLAFLAALLHRESKTNRIDWLIMTFTPIALFSPWIPTVWRWTRTVSQAFWIGPVTAKTPWDAYVHYAGSAVLLVAMLALAVFAITRTKSLWKGVLLISLTLLPVLIPILLSLILRPMFVDRYAIVAGAGLILLAAIGLTHLPPRRPAAAALVILLALSAFRIPTGLAIVHEHKPDARGAMAWLAQNARDGDIVYLNAGYAHITLLNYLRDANLEQWHVATTPDEMVAAASVPPGVRCWEVRLPRLPHFDATPAHTRLTRDLAWKPLESRDFDGVRIDLYTR